MKQSFQTFICGWTMLLAIPAISAPDDGEKSEPRLTVELRDSSRIVGTAPEKFFRFKSPLLGDVKLATANIRSVECLSSNATKVVTANGDTLNVTFTDTAITLKTGFGKIEVAVNSIRKLTINTSGRSGGAKLPGLVALWSGEDSGKDSVGSHDAELSDISFTEGKVGRAFVFNGRGSWANIPVTRSIDLADAEGFTIMAWIKPTDVFGFHPILEWEVTHQKSACLFWIGRNPQDQGVLTATIVGPNQTGYTVASPWNALMPGQFQHVALTYDKQTGTSWIYINGIAAAQKHIGSVTPETTGPIFLGWRPCSLPNDSTYERYFSGLLDELAIYNRSLSAEEIRAICIEQNNGEVLPTPPTGFKQPMIRQGGMQTFPISE